MGQGVPHLFNMTELDKICRLQAPLAVLKIASKGKKMKHSVSSLTLARGLGVYGGESARTGFPSVWPAHGTSLQRRRELTAAKQSFSAGEGNCC